MVSLLLPAAALAQTLASTAVPTGTWEGLIEDPRRPFVLTVDFAAGNAKLDAAASTSFAVEQVTSDRGRLRFQIALGSEPWRFDAEQQREELRGTVITPRREVPFWLRLLPERPAPRDRVEAWQQDLDVMLERFLRYDRSFSDAEQAAFRARLERLRRSLSARSDQQVMVELARAVALSRNAHTRLYLVRNRTEVRRLPIRTWWFKDRMHIVRATREHTDLLGCRVLGIGRISIESAAARVRGIKAGNASWQRYMSSFLLTSPDILAGAGILRRQDEVPLTLSCNGRVRRLQLAPLPLHKKATAIEAWWDLAPAYRDPDAMLPALPPERAPLYLRHPDEHYWFERMPELGALYFQYNRSQHKPDGIRLPEFAEQLARAVEEQPLVAFVVDLRFNTGGDLTLATPLVERLAAKLAGVPVFVLIGRATFSAGISHAVQWKQSTRVTVVGEPAGDDLDVWSEGGNLVLPNSRLTAHYSNGFHAYSKRRYREHEPYLLDLDVDSLRPDVRAEPSWADYASGRDTLLERVAERIQRIQRRAAPVLPRGRGAN